MPKYSVKLFQTLQSFQSLEGEWRQLLSLSSSDSIFLSWEWLYTWSKYYLGSDRLLFILLIYKEKELIGIAPWYLSRKKFGPFMINRLEFLGSPETGSDYLDVIIKKGEEEKAASIIYSYLFNDCKKAWDAWFFSDVPSTSLYFNRFFGLLENRGKFYEIKKGSFCPQVNLPSSTEDFYNSLSGNRRQQHKRHLRILEGTGELAHVAGEGSKSKILLNELHRLYNKRWGNGHDLFFRFIEEFIDRTHSNNTVQIDLLKKDNDYIAGIMHFNYKETRYMYLMAVDVLYNEKISIGNVFVGMCIQNAIENKLSQYDFLKGEEDFKFHWANAGNSSMNIYCYRNRPASVVFYSINCLKNIGKIALR